MRTNVEVVRKIDEIGRVTIPKDLRDILRLTTGDPVTISIDGDSLVLKKQSGTCFICSSLARVRYKGVGICDACQKDIKEGKHFESIY